MPVGLKRGLEKEFVPSGDYIDTAEENGMRIADKVPVVPSATITSSATNLYMLDAGEGTLGDGVSATGSTASVSFTATYTSAPYVVATMDSEGVAFAGSTGLTLAGKDTGSAVFFGPSGTAFQWFAYGKKY